MIFTEKSRREETKEEKEIRTDTRHDQETMAHSLKTEAEEGPSKDLQQRPKGERHTFKFSIRSGKDIIAEYDTSKTVFGAIKKFHTFSSPGQEKEIIIKRSKGNIPGAVVKTDFPCCLIEDDENFNIDLYNTENASTNQETTTDTDPQNLVTFYIRTRGKTIKTIMKSSVFGENNLDYVCVFAHKGDILKEALQHDGRFIDCIFDNGSELIADGCYKMNLTVDLCDGKKFELNVKSAGKKPINSGKNNGKPNNTEQKTTKEIKTDPSTEDHAAQNTAGNFGDLSGDSSQNPINTRQEKNKDGNTNPSTKRYVAKPIVNSEEILGILRAQFKDLLETLKQRENLRNKSEILKFFRAEYDKCVQSFSEVKKVKQLMRLSDSVCQIRVEGSARGTGFLLFDRFILTNAHVIGEFDPFTRKLSKTFTAVFGYEDLEAKETKCVPVKEHVAAYYHGKINMGTHLDFALLELKDADEITDCPGLLSRYIHPPTPNRGGICIVGHPGEEVKKMDHCFIIGKENLQEAADKHISENVNFIHVMTQQSLAEKWEMHDNQIIYDSCFFHGSSGSPVFDEDCYLIGVHTGGYVYKGEKGKTRSIMEYAYSMQPILESIITQAKKSERSDILKLLSEYKSLNLNLEDNDVDMEVDPQNQEDFI